MSFKTHEHQYGLFSTESNSSSMRIVFQNYSKRFKNYKFNTDFTKIQKGLWL